MSRLKDPNREWMTRTLTGLASGVLALVIHRWRRPVIPANPERGLRILHFAFEDHRRPGSGGGGVRTREINRRLAERHTITVVTTRFPGARRRVEEGVTYRPLGLPVGYHLNIISYHLATPLLLFFKKPDLVVEDFAAPMSSMLVPLWTRQPTVAAVQWLFATETSERYRLPFYLAEQAGVRLHTHFLSVSNYVSGRLHELNPNAHVDLVYAGADSDRSALAAGSSSTTSPRSSDNPSPTLLYLGRLQRHAKGLDLLLDAMKQLSDLPDLRLIIAGDGPYEMELLETIERLGLGPRVDLVGRAEGEYKWELLRSASLVVIPSRFESFGLVAVEALAAGAPVVAFALPSLQEIITPKWGVLVPPFDTALFADAIRCLLADPGRREDMAAAARESSAFFTWDSAATAQEKSYLAALAEFQPRSLLQKLRAIWQPSCGGRGSSGADAPRSGEE
jgi:glycosyltransferase involved in cell wall biosynthesis